MPLPLPALPYLPDDPASFEAAELLGQLHDALRTEGFGQTYAQDVALEELLVRVAFCCFAEANGIFAKNQFRDLLEAHTHPDGTDTAARLHQLFQLLSQPVAQRPARLPPLLATLPYLGEALFGEERPLPTFTPALRERLLACTHCAWERISPTVFGALFQAIEDPYKRSQLEARYTPDGHVFKVIGPLFLDELHRELDQAGHHDARLAALHHRISTLRLFDPACSAGNLLVVAYRELRRLELAVLQARFGPGPWAAEPGQSRPALLPQVTLRQCAGVALETFPARVAMLALWLVDHQLNQQLAATLGPLAARRPLADAPHIRCLFELEHGWETTFPGIDYILSNFLHSQAASPKYWQPDRPTSAGQRYGGGTYWQQIAKYIEYAPQVRAAMVLPKNSLQGLRNAATWQELQQDYGLSILFAHRPFAWKVLPGGWGGESTVVVGLGKPDGQPRQLFAYDTPLSEPRRQLVPHINHYLLAAPDVQFNYREQPLGPVPTLAHGSYALEEHYVLLDEDKRYMLLAREPAAAPYIVRVLSFIFFRESRPLWGVNLPAVPAAAWAQLPVLRALRDAEQQKRMARRQQLPPEVVALLAESVPAPIIPASPYVALPMGVRPEAEYLSAAYVAARVVPGSRVEYIPQATPYLFGMVISAIFCAWVRQLCEPWKYGYRNEGLLTYHNFPFPAAPTPAQIADVEAAVAAVRAVRGPHQSPGPVYKYWGEYLSPERAAAAAQLDLAVDRCFRPEPFATEQERLEFLFAAYQQQTAAMEQ